MPDTTSARRQARRFVLLDRDGTVLVERHYLAEPSGVELSPGAAAGLLALQRAGFGLVMITNQSGVARGLFDMATLGRIHERMVALLTAEGVRLDGIYVCPHGPDAGCPCRKPRTALVEQAAAELHFDPRQSFVVGDKVEDVQLGERLGATTILVQTGYGVQTAAQTRPDHITPDLQTAAALIIRLTAVPVDSQS